MPAATLPAQPKRRGVLAGVFGVILVAGFLLAVFPRGNDRTQAESLRDNVKPPPIWTVRDGKLIEGKQAGNDFVITASPVRGGAEQTLLSVSMLGRSIENPVITEKEFRFFTGVESPTNASGTGFIGSFAENQISDGFWVTPNYLRVFRTENFLATESPSALPAGAKRVVMPETMAPRKIKTRLHRVPLDGSPVQTQVLELNDVRGYPFWGDDGVFFYRAPRGTYTRVILPDNRAFNECPAQASLFVRPLSGGPERLIGSGLPSTWKAFHLLPDSIGASVRAPRPYPQSPDLLRFSAKSESPLRIPDFQGVNPPVLYGERLWWLEVEPVLDAPQSVIQKLVSCRPDGSDTQTIVLDKDADDRTITTRELVLCDGNLYLLYTREDELIIQEERSPSKVLAPHIARLSPDRGELISKSAPLPLKSTRFLPERCSGGYYYFFTEENRRDLFDFLKEETTDHKVFVFRRMRLPE